ncbi:MAG: TrbI/VirB10 family protein, partial [Bacteroidota bacterium]
MADFMPEREEPMAVMPQRNILHPKIPALTSFNKKTITIIVIILGVVLFFCILAIFQSPQKANQIDGETQAPKKTSGGNLIADNVNAIPGSYQGQDFSQKNIPLPVLPPDYQANMPPKDVNLNNNQLSPDEQTKVKARESQIRFVNIDQLSQNQNQTQKSNNFNPSNPANGYTPAAPIMPNLAQDQNGQDEKKAFLNSNTTTTFYTNSMGLRSPLSKFELKAGSVIPVTLITGVNSDLPGYISAQVRQNVYDTATG